MITTEINIIRGNIRFINYFLSGLNQIPNESIPNAQWMLKQIMLIAILKRIKNIIGLC